MNPLIERRLGETARQLVLIRAIKSSAVLLCVVTTALLLLGLIVRLGYINRTGVAWGLVTLILVAGGLAWLLTLLLNAVSPVSQDRLARETERANPGLMDRLHTLMFLRPRRHVQQVESYASRIELQSATVLFDGQASVPVLNRDLQRWIAVWLVLFWSTILYYQWFRPFSQLGLASSTPTVAGESSSLELPPTAQPPTKAADENVEPWLEVRVSDPGQDIVATRFESVPLLVEAATSDELNQVKVRTLHNGEPRPDVKLPTGFDPRFTRQEAIVDLKQRRARDWDVLSFQGTATSTSGMKAESQVYFVDVRPPQEEIERLPGGVEGEAYRMLSDLTGMVGAQEDAIRAAHRQGQLPAAQVDSQALSELAQTEMVLKRGIDYLAESLPEKAKLAPTADQLRRAAESFQKSADLLSEGQIKEGEQAAQRALGDLAAARRRIHQAVQVDPAALPSPLIDSDPLANLAEQLQKFEDLQNQLRTAAEEAAKLAAEERRVAQQIKPRDNGAHRQAANRQQELGQKFQQFRKEHAQACEQSSGACAKAGGAVGRFTEALDKLATQLDPAAHRNANSAGNASADALEQLAASLDRQATRQRNSATRQLQRALDKQIQFLEQVEDRPGDFTQQQLEQAVQNMQATTGELKEMAEAPQTREQFNDKLREKLNDENKSRLDQQCQGVCQNPGGGNGRGRAASVAIAGMRRVQSAMQSGGLGQSGGPGSGSSDQLATDSSQALERARRQLESLLREAAGGRPNRAAQRELLRDALLNVRVGMAPAGRGAASNDLLSALQEQLNDERTPIDLELLRRLMAQLDRVQVELVTEQESETRPNVSHLDPQNYPPGYRDWIQRYYRRLAEQP